MMDSFSAFDGSSDLAQFIATAPLIDTHEHLPREADFLKKPPDVLQDIFNNYITADLVVSGASDADIDRLKDSTNPDIRARFLPIAKAWERCQYTGYGEAVRKIASTFYGIEEITVDALEQAQSKAAEYRRPEIMRELLEQANIAHVQTDDFRWQNAPDPAGAEFFLYDLSWVNFCNGEVKPEDLEKEVGFAVRNLEELRGAMSALFAKYGKMSIAVKSQHAYSRPLRWEPREDSDVAPIWESVVAGKELNEAQRLALGDWCLARGVEQAIDYNLPFKIHTGYYAGHSYMPVDRIRSGHLCELLRQYPKAKFVLMHIAYPYSEELIALSKHYPNVWIDLCWAWSINPFAASDFVRRFIHAVPAHKLFGFGGDSWNPCASYAYALQVRQGLTRALEAEVADKLLTEKQALALAERFLRQNQEECFDIEGTRQAIHEALNEA